MTGFGFGRGGSKDPETNEQEAHKEKIVADQKPAPEIPKPEPEVSVPETSYVQQPTQPQQTFQTAENNMENNNPTLQELIGASATTTVLGNNSTEDLVKFKENVENILKAERSLEGLKFDVLTNNANLAIPGITFYKYVTGTVYYFSVLPVRLVLEGRLENRTEYLNNVKTQIDMPVSKIFDKDYCSAIENNLRGLVTSSIKEVRNCHYYVVPADLNLEEERTAKIIVDIANNAITQQVSPTPPLAGEALASDKIDVTLTHVINETRTATATDGTPVAADVTIKLVAAAKSEKRQGLNSGMNSLTLARTFAKLDLIKQDPRMFHGGMSAGFNAMQGPFPGYHPVITITETEGYIEGTNMAIENSGTSAAAIASLCQLTAGRNFMSLLDTRKDHPRNVGLLGYDHEPLNGVKFEPRKITVERTQQASKEENRTLNEMADFFFHPNSMTLQLDIGDGTRTSYAHNIWLAISAGDAAANEYMIAVFDRFTKGNFAKLWKEQTNGAMLARPGHVLVHAGTYEDEKGKKHDIREIDYFYMLGVCKEASVDLNQGVMPMMATFAPGATNGNDGLKVLDMRRNSYERLEPSVNITGFIRRLMLHADLPRVLGMALHSAGLHFNPEGLYDNQANHNMAYQGFVPGAAVDTAIVSGILQPQMTGGQPNYYQHNPYMPGANWGQR